MFNPPIGKLDKLTFTWYDITGAIIDNSDCEWSGSIQIVETMDVATIDSTIPKIDSKTESANLRTDSTNPKT
jgi:hypothetical protein